MEVEYIVYSHSTYASKRKTKGGDARGAHRPWAMWHACLTYIQYGMHVHIPSDARQHLGMPSCPSKDSGRMRGDKFTHGDKLRFFLLE